MVKKPEEFGVARILLNCLDEIGGVLQVEMVHKPVEKSMKNNIEVGVVNLILYPFFLIRKNAISEIK